MKMLPSLFQPEISHRILLSGNEAYVRGLFEAGVQFFAIYPGTPVSEIGDLWESYAMANEDVWYDLAVNETVAFEAAVGASWSGVRAAVAFKHLGMNLILDALHAVMYSGVKGLVLIVGGDPDILSSTNAVDIRLFALHAKIPILEPASVQECKNLVHTAFELSEKMELPVLIYSPSRLNHTTELVECSPPTQTHIHQANRYFQKNRDKYLNAIHWAKRNQAVLHSKIFQLQQNYIEGFPEQSLYSITGSVEAEVTKWMIVESEEFSAFTDDEVEIDDETILIKGEEYKKSENDIDSSIELPDSWKFLTQQEEWENIDKVLDKMTPDQDIQREKQSPLHIQNHPLEPPSKDSVIKTDDVQNFPESTLIGFISVGISETYVEEFCVRLNKKCPHLHLRLTYPVQKQPLLTFLETMEPDILFIVEEQEPLIELQIKDLFYEFGITIPILGKNILSSIGSLSPDQLISALANPFYLDDTQSYIVECKSLLPMVPQELTKLQDDLPVREPTFCPGCAYRNVFYSLKQAVSHYEKKTGKEVIFGGDIGCYTLSMSAPFLTMDWLVCMGAGVGIANGVTRVTNPEKQTIVAMIGDSTFFHSGIPPLINLVKNQTDIVILLLDNYFCAMTGDQLTPSTPTKFRSDTASSSSPPITIRSILSALGITNIKFLDGYHISRMIDQLEEILPQSGIRVALVEAECALHKTRRARQTPDLPISESIRTELHIAEYCSKCNECFEKLGCPAIQCWENQYYIDQNRCIGEECLSCIDICPNHAIRKTVLNPHLHPKSPPKLSKQSDRKQANSHEFAEGGK